MAADSEISLLTRDPILSKATRKTWPAQPAEEDEDDEEEEREEPHVKFLPPEGGLPSPELRCFDSESISIHESAAETRPSDATHTKLNLSFDTSQKSDTTLEFYDALLLPEDQEREEGQTAEEDKVVTVNIKNPTENEEAEEQLSQTIEQTPVLTSEDTAREEEEEENEDETFEDVMEIGLEEEAKHVEEVLSKEEDEQEVQTISKHEDAATPPQEEMSTQGNSESEYLY